LNKDHVHAQGWSDIDRTATAGQFVQYLDTMTGLTFTQDKRRTFELLEAGPGRRILDLGCGTGDDVRALAAMVGPSGRVTGVDSSAAMVAEAQQRSDTLGLPVEFHVGDGHALDFPDGTFDGARADRTLQHLADPAKTVAEMVRVLRPGGHLVASEPDWDTLVVDVPDRTVTRAIVSFRSDEFRQGRIGRQLNRLLTTAGLHNVAIMPMTMVLTDYALADRIFGIRKYADKVVAAGLVEKDAARRWVDQLDESVAAGRFFCAVTAFIAAGRKP
jgi:ubiquinone/menaquinone biosynthesis C-methylase UbiE